MKQAVIIAPQFPPSNLTAGHRSRYFAMHLPKFGWKVKVLSVKPQFYEEKLDAELEKLIPDDLEVIRTNAFSSRPLRLIGDISIRAFWRHYQALSQLIKKEKIDLVYIPIPPNYSALLGPLIYRKFGIPYAIDYIDPWCAPWPGSEVLFSKAWFSYKLSCIIEPMVLKNVSLITAVAPAYYAGVLVRYPWLNECMCLALPYGAEESDFRYLDQHPRPPYLFDPQDGFLHFVYCGAMLPRAFSTLEALFKSILILNEKFPALTQKFRFHFIGTGKNYHQPKGGTIKAIAKYYNITDSVFEYPERIPYLDVLTHLRYAHAILILGSAEAHYTPSKVFQAILARRPILAFLHAKSSAVDILKKTNSGIVITFDELNPVGACIDEIVEALFLTMHKEYVLGQTKWDVLRDYSAEVLTHRLAEAFEQMIKNNNSKRRGF